MNMQTRVKWQMFSARVKRLLADGNVDGLDMLQLDSIDSEVLEIHVLRAEAVAE